MKLNKKEKLVRWASNKKVRSLNKMKTELGYTSDEQVMDKLNSVVRHGLITYKKLGRKIQLNLTKTAYYNRTYLVS